MQVQVSGKQVAVGDTLMSRIEGDVNGCIGRYFERGGIDAEVVVSRDGYAFRVDCVVRLASGQQLDSHGSGGDAYAAFGSALTKIERRVRRYKRRIKNHHRPVAKGAPEAASAIVLGPPADEDEDEGWEALTDAGPDEPPSALVIAEARTALRTMTVAMAVRALDLTESQTIVFRNAAHGGLSVVYRRPDGNIGWMDPERPDSMNGAYDEEGGGLSLRSDASRNGARGRP